LRLFADRGYEETSIRAIVAKARVNQAAINYHFGGKDGLYREFADGFSRPHQATASIAEGALAAEVADHQHDQRYVHGARALPAVRLLSKSEVLAITSVTFPMIWSWMRAGTFPRSRVVGGKSMWRSDEIDAWLAALPVRALKGDDVEAVT
jgi:AcrR family transcriptional regulator